MHPRTLAWFEQYAADHQHPTNRLTHKIAIPVIVFHIFAMLWKLPLVGESAPWLTVGLLSTISSSAFWIVHLPRAGTLLAIAVSIIGPLGAMLSWPVLLALAVVGWSVQLAGHSVWEKNRPSFLTNMFQSLVGPLFFTALLTGEWPRRPASVA